MNRYISAPSLMIWIMFGMFFSNAHGHSKSESYSNWTLNQNNITGIITIPSHEVTRLPEIQSNNQSLSRIFLDHAKRTINIKTKDETCTLKSNQSLNASEAFIRIELQYQCDTDSVLNIDYRTIFDVSPSHTHYAKIYKQGILISELLLNNSSGLWEIDSTIIAQESNSLSGFFKLGVEHILGGYDHLAFLFGILLVANTITRSIIAISGFTLGHSASLFVATIGLVEVSSRIVEVFIGFTIALMAIEYANKRTSKHSSQLSKAFPLILFFIAILGLMLGSISLKAGIGYFGLCLFTYCYLNTERLLTVIKSDKTKYLLLSTALIFGFIHGLGFAGFLKDSGIENTDILWPLLGFNLGLEFGQLCIIATVWIIFRRIKHLIKEPIPSIASGGLFGIGFYWLILRTFT